MSHLSEEQHQALEIMLREQIEYMRGVIDASCGHGFQTVEDRIKQFDVNIADLVSRQIASNVERSVSDETQG